MPPRVLTEAQLARRLMQDTEGLSSVWADTALSPSLRSHLHLHDAAAGESIDMAVVAAARVSASGAMETVTDRDTVTPHLTHARRIIAVLAHLDDAGHPRIVTRLSDGTAGVAHRILTELGIIDVTHEGLLLRELAPKVSARDVQERVEPPLLAGPDLKPIDQTSNRDRGPSHD